uniref:Uncharacterized protein n=1 Tax=Glossina austeni TaxID=7395 RepID=A0A1A9VDI8_GLOAU
MLSTSTSLEQLTAFDGYTRQEKSKIFYVMTIIYDMTTQALILTPFEGLAENQKRNKQLEELMRNKALKKDYSVEKTLDGCSCPGGHFSLDVCSNLDEHSSLGECSSLDRCSSLDELSSLNGHSSLNRCSSLDRCSSVDRCCSLDENSSSGGRSSLDEHFSMDRHSSLEGHSSLDGHSILDRHFEQYSKHLINTELQKCPFNNTYLVPLLII